MLEPTVPAHGLQEHGVGDDVGLAPAAEHIVEQAERVGDPAAVAEHADQWRVRVGVWCDGHGADEPARGVEMAVAAIPRDEGVVGEDIDGGPGALGGAEHAGGIGGATPAAEVADELGAEVDVGGLPVAGAGALDEAHGTGEVLAGNEAAEVGAGGVGGVGRLGPRSGSGGGGEVLGLGVGEVGVREWERRLEERGHGDDWRVATGWGGRARGWAGVWCA